MGVFMMTQKRQADKRTHGLCSKRFIYGLSQRPEEPEMASESDEMRIQARRKCG